MKKLSLTPETFDTLFLAVDHLEAIVYSIAEGGEGKRDVKDVVEKLQLIEKGRTNRSKCCSRSGSSKCCFGEDSRNSSKYFK